MATAAQHRERSIVYMNSMRRMLKERMDEHRENHPALTGYPPTVTEEFVQKFLILARMYTDEKIAALEAVQAQAL